MRKDKKVLSSQEFTTAINSQTPNKSAWKSPFSKVDKSKLPPKSIVRGKRTLIVEPESGYWEVVPNELAKKAEANIGKKVEILQINAPNEESFNSDLYPLESVLYLTNKCNLNCTYCYSIPEREADWNSFKPELLEKCIRLLFNEPRRQSLSFLLFGGESLAAFDLLVRTVDYVEKLNYVYKKSVVFRMQTNGSLIDDRKAAYFKRKNIQVGVSLDGPEEIHNKNRLTKAGKGTYNDVMRGIECLKRQNVPFSVISTVGSPKEIVPVFDFFMQENITSRVKISPVLPEGSAKNLNFEKVELYAREWGRENLKAALKLIEHNKVSPNKLREGNLNSMSRHLVQKERPDLCLRTPCGAAYGMVEFHPDGSLVTCDKTLYSKELGVVAKVQDIAETDSILDILDNSPLIQQLRNRKVDNIPKCSRCMVKRHCGGSCTLGSYDFFKDFYREDVMCAYRNFMFEELMWILAEDPINSLLLMNPESVGA